MKFAYAAILLSVFCSFNFSTPTWADSGSVFKLGIEAYNGKRFHAAEDLLTQAISVNPSDQNAHFWLGKTLEQLLDAKAAKAEYENCYKINPFSPIGVNARKASMDVAGRTASEAVAPLDDVKTVTKTTQIINSQANELKGRYQAWGQAGSDWRLGQIHNNIYGVPGYGNTFNQGYNGNYNNNNNPYANGYPGGYGGGYAGAYNPNGGMGGGFNNANNYQNYNPNANYGNGNYGYQNPWAARGNWVSNTNQIRSSWIRADAQVQAYKYKTAGTNAAAAAQESANNLERLLAEKPAAGQPHLRATGTNLFVRYYGTRANDGNQISEPPADPIEELHATAQRLSNASRSAIKTESVSSALSSTKSNFHTDLAPLPADLRVRQPDPPAIMGSAMLQKPTAVVDVEAVSPPAPVSSITGLPDVITGASQVVAPGESVKEMVATPKTLGTP